MQALATACDFDVVEESKLHIISLIFNLALLVLPKSDFEKNLVRSKIYMKLIAFPETIKSVN